MDLNEILKTLRTKYLITRAPNSFKEYKHYYLFFMHSEMAMDGVLMFDKDNKKLVPYNPMNISPTEIDRPIRTGKLKKADMKNDVETT